VQDITFTTGLVAAPTVYQDVGEVPHPVLPPGSREDTVDVLGFDPKTMARRDRFPKTRAEFEALQPKIAAAVERYLGARPPFPQNVVVQTDSVRTAVTRGGVPYTISRFRFHNGVDAVVPGVLVVPEKANREPVPLILYAHYHGGEFNVGKESLFRFGRDWPRSKHDFDHRETRDVAPEDLGDWPDGANNLAELLMGEGRAVLSIDDYGFGERQGQGPGGPDQTGQPELDAIQESFVAKGRTRIGMAVRDKQIALELASRQLGIDRTRRGVTGMSMGSWSSMQLGFVEPSLNPVIPMAGVQDYDIAMLSALAPGRRLVQLNGDSDPGNAPIYEVGLTRTALEEIYGFYGAGHNYESIVTPNLGHDITVAQVRKALEVFDETWAGQSRAATARPPPG
jgi:dienelactone hydrolase